MTTPDLTVRITEILRKHQWRKYEDRCRCDDPGTYDEHPDHVAALIAQAAEQYYRPGIETVEQLDALPDGVVVASSADTFAARFDRVHGVIFGHDQPFRWLSLQLPVRVLWSPGAGE